MDNADLRSAADTWVHLFETALSDVDPSPLSSLLDDPSYLRDNGALTWDYRQFHGRSAVIDTLLSLTGEIQPHDFSVSTKWPTPHFLVDGETVEAFFDFKTRHGHAVLLVNAVLGAENPSGIKAQAMFTRLEDLNGIERTTPHPRGLGYTPSQPGETWLQHRAAARDYRQSDPDVIVVGAGQSGVTTAAYLRRFGVDVLNVDRYDNVGDSWARRYAALSLHNPVEMNGFPFLPYPPHYPEYLPKDLMGEWLDIYARYMDLNVWTRTEFLSGTYDTATGRWIATFRRGDGTERRLRPRHIVMATGGIGGRPYVPELPGLSSFDGPVLHSSQYTARSDYPAERTLIVGVATSAHDIARDLTTGGVEVTMFQRGPVIINNVATANLAYAAYMDKAIPTELVDIRYGIGLINPLRERGSQQYHAMAKKIDTDLLTRLEAAGLRLGDGVDGQGWLDLFLRTGGGYYLNTGTSEMIADRRIKIEQFDRIVEFVADGARLDDGTKVKADMIILATGYQSRMTEVIDYFGDDIAGRVGEIARLDEEGEWANMWGQSGQPGLWFNGGGINQMRPGSQRLALLIKADLDGLISERFRRRPKRQPIEVVQFAQAAE